MLVNHGEIILESYIGQKVIMDLTDMNGKSMGHVNIEGLLYFCKESKRVYFLHNKSDANGTPPTNFRNIEEYKTYKHSWQLTETYPSDIDLWVLMHGVIKSVENIEMFPLF